ncbi:hypothetical protein [Oryza sativa Japonica Group]|uniref:Uncharacterized protein P0034C09.39 n=1 Tax=Oryza sativa subsp. japonica TaxID=39947 RepID=Q5N7Q3_ORYSJ|nr:hypothetical protein [Oryza sativa Japonica Group]
MQRIPSPAADGLSQERAASVVEACTELRSVEHSEFADQIATPEQKPTTEGEVGSNMHMTFRESDYSIDRSAGWAT